MSHSDTVAHAYGRNDNGFTTSRYVRDPSLDVRYIPIANLPHPWVFCLYWRKNRTLTEDEAVGKEFIEKYLAPALDEYGLSHIKIIIWDHNKERVYDRARDTLASPAVNSRVWAVGHHWYSGDHFEGLRLVHEQLGKTLISSEICGVIDTDVIKVADHLIDIGPEGGAAGGRVVATGTPQEIAACTDSYTGSFLKPLLTVAAKKK